VRCACDFAAPAFSAVFDAAALGRERERPLRDDVLRLVVERELLLRLAELLRFFAAVPLFEPDRCDVVAISPPPWTAS
jgi:hypothetical protein